MAFWRFTPHAALASALLAVGCQAPGPPPAADAVPPPANLDTSGAPPSLARRAPYGTGGWDGKYAGRGLLTEDPGGQLGCPADVPAYGMSVSNGVVDFGEYHGRIRPDGSVEMPFRNTWITGTFSGGQFNGNLFQPFPGCRYALRMSRVGS